MAYYCFAVAIDRDAVERVIKRVVRVESSQTLDW